MTDTPDNPPENDLDQGLAEAFRKDTAAADPSMSVLAALQARTNSTLGVHLDSPSPDGAPTIVTDDAKALRDPSGRYQVLGEVGRGGVGVVYKGRDQDLGRDVAMKVLRDDYADHPEVLARFIEEAQIGGQLQHPGIVPVYELGLHAGERPYFAMKLVKGETLSAQLTQRLDPGEDRRKHLGIFEQICQTMAYAHSRFVVHRDLKPSNVMIGAFGEVQIVDWGFAKVLERGGNADERASIRQESQRSVIETIRSAPGSGTQSIVGSMLGTPAYMPPEQALGDIENLDARSDVFGLGAILCEILTGVPPYREGDGDVIRQAAAGNLDPAHERIRQSGADEAIITLCIQCLSRARQARPASAQEVAAQVAAYLTSVEERAQQAELRATRAHYRQRTTILLSAAALLLLSVGGLAWYWVDANQRQQLAEANDRVATASSDAREAFGRAREANLDAELWSAAIAAANRLQQLATSEPVTTELQNAAAGLLASIRAEQATASLEIERRRRDQRMSERLISLRMPTDHDMHSAGWPDREHKRLDAAYGDAFATFMGTPLADLSVEAALAILRKSDLKIELAASLDHLSMIRDAMSDQDSLKAGTARLRTLAMALDSDNDWRNELRSLLPNAEHKAPELRELASRIDAADLTPTNFLVLARALFQADARDENIRLLQRGRELFPNNFSLAFELSMRHVQLEQQDWHGTLAALDVARAIAPDQDEVLHRQGIALGALSRHKDAERVFHKLIARNPDNAHWHMHLGETLLDRKKPAAAIECIRKALALEPDTADIVHYLGMAQYQLGQRDEALASYKRALELDPNCGGVHSSLGRYYSGEQQFETAIAHHQKCIARESGDPRPHVSLGATLRESGDHEAARKSFRAALQQNKSHARAYTGLARSFFDCGDWEAAIREYRAALVLDPNSIDAVSGLGSALVADKQYQAGLETFTGALALGLEQAHLHLNIGIAHLLMEQLDLAVTSLQRAVAIDPHLALAHCQLGVCLLKKNRTAEAISRLERALQEDPNCAVALGQLGQIAAQRQQIDKALRYFQRTALLTPNDSALLHNIGHLLDSQGKRDQAIDSYRKAIRVQPGLVPSQVNLANLLIQQGREDEAISSLRDGLRHNPDSADMHSRLAQIQLKKGYFDDAVASFRQQIQHSPAAALPLLHFNLGDRLQANGKMDAAMRHYEAVIAIDPKHARAHNGIARLLQQRGDHEQALRSFRLAAEFQPGEAGIHFNLARELTRQGQYAEALSSMRTARDIWDQTPSTAGWAERAANEVKTLQRATERLAALFEILRGEREAGSEPEWLACLQLATRAKHYRDGARVAAHVFDAFPEVRTKDAYAYDAACVAVLAASGQGVNADSLTGAERTRLREQALQWLQQDLQRWRPDANGKLSTAARKQLRWWSTDKDLASVRDQQALYALPITEARKWHDLWRQVTLATKQ